MLAHELPNGCGVKYVLQGDIHYSETNYHESARHIGLSDGCHGAGVATAAGQEQGCHAVYDAGRPRHPGLYLLTKYELGVFKVLPVKAHLALDVMSALTLLVAPTLLGEEGATATTIRGMGVMELGVVSLTETKPPLGERVRQALS